MKNCFVYIMTTVDNTALYTGITSDLKHRYYQHLSGAFPGSFTSKYNCRKLVYYKEFVDVNLAIKNEKRIKAGSRKKKIILIERSNPEWRDLGPEITADD